MINIIELLMFSLGSFEVSQLLNAYADTSAFETYKAIGEKYGINKKNLKESYEAEDIMYDKSTKVINYIPVLNLIKSYILLNKKRSLHQDIVNHLYDYFPEIAPKYIKEQKICGTLPIGEKKKSILLVILTMIISQ